MIVVADPYNPKHQEDIKKGAVEFCRHADRSDIMPDVDTEEGLKNLMQAVDGMMHLNNVTIFLVYENDKCVGGAGVLVSPYIFDYTKITSDELFWWTDKDASIHVAISLLKALQDFIKGCKADFSIFHHLHNSPKAVSRIYKAMGLRELQTTYAGVI